jgi:hypothetical protein
MCAGSGDFDRAFNVLLAANFGEIVVVFGGRGVSSQQPTTSKQ